MTSRDSLAVERPRTAQSRGLPLLMVTMARQALEREIRSNEMQQQLSRAGAPMPGAPSQSPTVSQSYEVASDVRLVQLGDTIWRIRGCPGAPHAETIVFRLFGRDSVQRVTSPARTFGEAMATSLVGQMQMASVRRDLARRQSTLPPGLPRAPDPCGRGQ